MRNCMMNAISLGCIAVGSFLLGSSFGLALSKDESDIFEENCIKLDDVSNPVYTKDEFFDILIEKKKQRIEKEEQRSKESYNRMVNRIYGPKSDFDVVYGSTKNYLEEDEDSDIFDEESEAFEATIKEVEVDGETMTVKQTTEGLIEVTEPCVISEDDFFDPNQYPEYDQDHLIYYAKDDVLTDEHDVVIYDAEIENIIGSEALTSFGSMTLDKDTVFVRNDKLGMKYEVTRDDGSYQEVVLGYSDEDDDRAYKKACEYFERMEE